MSAPLHLAADPADALGPAVHEILEDFLRAWPDALIWVHGGSGWHERRSDAYADDPPEEALEVADGIRLRLASLPREATIPVARFLADALSRARRHDEEIRSFSREMAERYEEINLLYSISEILGSIISLDQAARTILEEVASILGASRAALWVFDGSADVLRLAAEEGGGNHMGPVAVDDPCSVTADVFRNRRAVILAPDEEWPRPGCEPAAAERGAFLSVPVSYTPPEGRARTIGVINLIGRSVEGGFSAGDQKLLAAVASQVGAAVENGRLVEETLRREGMVREMQLAHDLQLKLLPQVEQFVRYAEVSARCVPAESVGGDFYHLFRLPGGRLGVLIGDVSSHGFGAALIMALAMGSVAIYAAEGDNPADVLSRTHQAVIDELETTEMYLTLFYCVIDPAMGTLTYSNAGHSHAFVIPGDGGAPQRLHAIDVPLGMVETCRYGEATVPWAAESDVLFLFTDGLSDALGLGEVEGERVLLAEVARRRSDPCERLIDHIFAHPAAAPDIPPDDRTAVLVRM